MIAISAKKRHGKDTVADYICASRGMVKYALASPFKKAIVACSDYWITEEMIDGINYDREQEFFFNGDHVVEMFKSILREFGYHAAVYSVDWRPIRAKSMWSVRSLMQTIGTDIGCNQVDTLIWMHPLAKKIYQGQHNLVISDCRQEHEMTLMRQLGAKVIHVVNPHIKDTDTHSTEAGLAVEDFDIIIHNNYNPEWDESKKKDSLIKLHAQIEAVLNELKI